MGEHVEVGGALASILVVVGIFVAGLISLGRSRRVRPRQAPPSTHEVHAAETEKRRVAKAKAKAHGHAIKIEAATSLPTATEAERRHRLAEVHRRLAERTPPSPPKDAA